MVLRFGRKWIGTALVGVGALVLLWYAVGQPRAAMPPPESAGEPPTRWPAARAEVRGGPLAPELSGTVDFVAAPGGAWVVVDVRDLPPYQPGDPPIGPHGFHLHENGTCEVGDPADPFQAAGGHWNPDGQPHGNHAGDFPVLFSNEGRAQMRVFTSRFEPEQVIGLAVIIHENPDDFRSQPAGASGRRLACGVVEEVGRTAGIPGPSPLPFMTAAPKL